MRIFLSVLLLVVAVASMGCGDSAANNSAFNANRPANRNTSNANAVNTTTTNVGANQTPANSMANANSSRPRTTPTPRPTPGISPTPVAEEGVFSFPPPRATDYIPIDAERLMNPAGQTDFYFVADQISAALKRGGYAGNDYKFFRNGESEFAIVTKMERVDGNGRPLDGPDRWEEGLPTAKGPGEYFQFLFGGKTVYYRVFAFIVTDREPSGFAEIPNFEAARKWTIQKNAETQLGIGASDPIRSAVFQEPYRCFALLYLFVDHTSLDQPLPIPPGGSQGGLTHGLMTGTEVQLTNARIFFVPKK